MTAKTSASEAWEISPSGEFRGSERFSVVRRIGAGGMGVVYHARDRAHGTDVALKTLRQLDAAAIYHLKQEFRALADVRHRNLVRLFELVADGPLWFFTMELVEGVNFLEWVRRDDVPVSIQDATVDEPEPESLPDRSSPRGLARSSGLRVSPKLDFERLRASLVQLAEGVVALHAAGKVHRDVKPSNILVTKSGEDAGRVVLLDFGLAIDMRGDSRGDATLQTLERNVLGTPEYMSPEQGSLRELGAPSDWYSVGVVLFEALTGGLPFVGSALDILMAKEREDGPAPGAFVEGLPEDLDALCTALLRRDPHTRPTGEEVLRKLRRQKDSPTASVPPPPISKNPARTVLLGREKHIDGLSLAFRRSRQGRAVSLHLHGPAGVGKSALLRKFLDEIAIKQQALVLSGACYENESVPYKALDGIIDALSRYLRRLTRLQAEAILPRDVHAIARLFPVLDRVEAVVAAPHVGNETPDPAELRRRAFAALRELFARVADRRALVLAIDDLQWGDLDSIALLSDLLRPPYPPSMMLVAAYRDEDAPGNPTLRALHAMHQADDHKGAVPAHAAGLPVDLRGSTTARRRRRSAACEVYDIGVEPLGPDDARVLASGLLEGLSTRPSELVGAVALEAGGNPFLILEYARWLRAHPELAPSGVTLDAMIDSRLAPLDRGARRLVEVLAVSGRPISSAIAARAAEVDDDHVAQLRLRDEHLVRSVRTSTEKGDVDALEAWHGKIAEAVVRRLSATDLADTHLRLANAIEASGAEEPEALATHFCAAGARWKASHYAAIAARRAEKALAFVRAAALWQLAIDLAPPNAPELRAHHIARADALVNAGRGREAAKEYLAAADEAGEIDMLELHRRAAQNLLQSGHVDEGLAVFDGVLAVLGEKLPKSPRRALASLFFRRTQLRFRGLGFEPRTPDAISADDLSRIDTFWALTTGFGLVDVIVGADFGTRHLIAALRAGDRYRLVRAFTAETVFTAGGGEPARARTELLVKTTQALAEQVDDPHAYALAGAADAFFHYGLGQWKIAREKFRRAERTFRERCRGVAWELTNVRHFHLGCLTWLGELRRLAERVPALLEEGSQRGDLLAQTSFRVGSASLLWLVHDDPDGGRRDVTDAMRKWSRRGFLLQHFYQLVSMSQFDLYAANPRSAWKRVLDTWPALEASLLLRMQRVRLEAYTLRARVGLAAIATPGGTRDAAIVRDIEKFAGKILDERMPWSMPFVHAIRGALLHQGGDDARAVEQLAQAARGFDAADMNLHGQAARRRLGALLGGDKGRALVSAADVWLASEDVQDPTRLVDVLLPGFG